jgi:hypothetical protein
MRQHRSDLIAPFLPATGDPSQKLLSTTIVTEQGNLPTLDFIPHALHGRGDVVAESGRSAD